MSFIAEDNGRNFEHYPAGMYLARCYWIIDLGTQKFENMGQVMYLHKIKLGWEIHGSDDAGKPLKMMDGRPFAVFKNYTLSWSEKGELRIDLQSWRGKAFTQEELRHFNLKSVLGAWCMLNITERADQDGNIHASVGGITPVPSMIEQDGLPEPVNSNAFFTLNDPDMEIFANFSDSLKAKITASPEWEQFQLGPDDDY